VSAFICGFKTHEHGKLWGAARHSVDNSPEDNLAGRDRQLEAAVEELLKQLGSAKRNIASKEQQ